MVVSTRLRKGQRRALSSTETVYGGGVRVVVGVVEV